MVTSELGTAGNAGPWGYANTGEYLQKLSGAAGHAVFDKMRRSDYQVQAVMRAITLPIRQANFEVLPGEDTEKDREIAGILQNALLQQMTMTWDDTIRHALLMLPFGFSPMEKVYEYRDNLVLPKKLDPRLPQSVVRWKYDTAKRRLTHVVQRDELGREIELPIEKMLVFSTDKEGDNWEGISILRSAYKPWYIKDSLEKINAVMHERFGAGVPKAKVPKGVTKGTKEHDQVRETLQDIHSNEKAYLIEPDGYTFDILGGGKGQGTNVLESIEYYDQAIAKAMLAMHINLGTSKTGSRSLGQSFIDAFLMATQAWADYIAEVINRFCVRELVDLNWSVRTYPRFRCKRIHGLDLQAIGYLAQAGVITNTQDLENDLREVLRLPKISDAEEWAAQQQRRQAIPTAPDRGEGE